MLTIRAVLPDIVNVGHGLCWKRSDFCVTCRAKDLMCANDGFQKMYNGSAWFGVGDLNGLIEEWCWHSPCQRLAQR